MARNWFEAQAAQYKHAAAQGDGLAVWDGGVKCYLPSATLYGGFRQDGTPAPDAPAPIAHGGGTVAVRSRNLFNTRDRVVKNLSWSSATRSELSGNNIFVGYASSNYCSNANATLVGFDADSARLEWRGSKTAMGYGIGFDFPCRPNTTYYFNYTAEFGTISPAVACFDKDKTFIRGGGVYDSTFTTPENCHWFVFVFSDRQNTHEGVTTISNINLSIGEKLPAKPYIPPFDGGSVTAPALYAIPDTDYRDEWNAVTGQGARWCHALTFDGTEEWGAAFPNTADSHTFYLALPHPAAAARCSHFPVGRLDTDPAAAVLDISFAAGYLFINHPSVAANDVEAFKTWLAQQSAAGTPVTVVYAALNSGLTDVVAEPFTHRPDARLMQPDGCGQLIQTGGGAVSPLSATYVTHC